MDKDRLIESLETINFTILNNNQFIYWQLKLMISMKNIFNLIIYTGC